MIRTIQITAFLAELGFPLAIFVDQRLNGDVDVEQVKQTTQTLMMRAGVLVRWVSLGEAADQHGVTVQLVKRCLSEHEPNSPVDAGERVLGCALRPTDAVVCVPQVRDRAARHFVQPEIVMAYVAAHEIGHLFLGPGHSATGILKANWNRTDMNNIRRLWLDFEKSDKEALRCIRSLTCNHSK